MAKAAPSSLEVKKHCLPRLKAKAVHYSPKGNSKAVYTISYNANIFERSIHKSVSWILNCWKNILTWKKKSDLSTPRPGAGCWKPLRQRMQRLVAHVISNRRRHIIEALSDVNSGAFHGVTYDKREGVFGLLRYRRRHCELNEHAVMNK